MKTLILVASILSTTFLDFVVAKPVPTRAYTPSWEGTKHFRPAYEKRSLRRRQAEGIIYEGTFEDGVPDNEEGKGGPISGVTNHQIDLENPDNLGRQSTDGGSVVNLKWRMSDSKTAALEGGWTRQQVITDLPASKDIAGAQQYIEKGGIRELHWHRVAEWGYLYKGSLGISVVDEEGRNQYEIIEEGDIWYFPKGMAHAIQGVADHNEFLLTFDDGDFAATGTTFNVADWINHTPKDILAKNFGVDESVFEAVPSPNPVISDGTVSTEDIESPYGKLEGNLSTIFRASQMEPTIAPGGGGSVKVVDSRNFPIATTIASAIVTLKPGGLRELHWHPNDEEWLFFLSGQAQATVFIGTSNARTFDFLPGDTAVFPDNSGHYIENTSETEDLVWIEIYNSDRAVSISLAQWLALTPVPMVAQNLKLPEEFVRSIKDEAQFAVI